MSTYHTSKAHNWKQKGNVYLWRYIEGVKNYPGWNFAVDEDARLSLTNLLLAFVKDDVASHRAVALTKPTDTVLIVPNNRGGIAKFKSPAKARVLYQPGVSDAGYLTESNGSVEWEIGRDSATSILSVLGEPDRYFDQRIINDPAVWWWGIV